MTSSPRRHGSVRGAAVLLVATLLGWSGIVGCSARLARNPGGDTLMALEDGGCLAAFQDALIQRRNVPGIAGTGRVHFTSDTGRGRASFDFIFRRPDSLRLQFLSPLGPTAAVLDLTGEGWLFADFREGVYIRGRAGADDFHRLTGLPAEPRTLISILLAEPLPGEGGVAHLRFDADTCLPLCCEFRGRPPAHRPTAVEYLWPGAPDPVLDDIGELQLPERILFSGPEPHRLTTIRFKSVRPLTSTEQTQWPEKVDISGLRQAVPDAEDADIPRWLR